MSEWQIPQYMISTSTSWGPGSRRSKLNGSRMEVGLLAAYPRVGNMACPPSPQSQGLPCCEGPLHELLQGWLDLLKAVALPSHRHRTSGTPPGDVERTAGCNPPWSLGVLVTGR